MLEHCPWPQELSDTTFLLVWGRTTWIFVGHELDWVCSFLAEQPEFKDINQYADVRSAIGHGLWTSSARCFFPPLDSRWWLSNSGGLFLRRHQCFTHSVGGLPFPGSSGEGLGQLYLAVLPLHHFLLCHGGGGRLCGGRRCHGQSEGGLQCVDWIAGLSGAEGPLYINWVKGQMYQFGAIWGEHHDFLSLSEWNMLKKKKLPMVFPSKKVSGHGCHRLEPGCC